MASTPDLRVQDFGASLKVLFVDNTDLTRNRRSTYMTDDVVATGTTLKVQSVVGFESLTTGSGQILCIGEIGQERTELVRTSNTSGEFPSNATKTVYLRDALSFDHPQDTKVYIVNWNRIEFDYAASASGTKTTIVAYPLQIQADQAETVFRDLTEPADRLTGAPTTAFYFARFNENIGSRNSGWSDTVYGTGYDDNSVFAIKQRAIESLGEEVDGNVITHEFLNKSLWEARREYHSAPGKRPFRRKFNVNIGTAFTGSFRIDLPTDVERPFTAENVYGVRIGTGANMLYYDKKAWDFDYRDKPHTTLTTAYTVGARDLYVTSARDFADSGAVSIEGTSIEYSAKSNSGGTLRISTDGSWDTSAGSDVWQNISYGMPDRFTVWADPGGSAYIYFNMPISTSYIGQNIYADYYRTLVGYDSDADILDEPEYDLYEHYLMAKIKHRKRKGEGDITNDPDFKLFQFKKASALSREYIATDIRIAPDVDHLNIPE